MNTDTEDFLEHYGVMGMRWGQRTRSEVAVTDPRREDFKNKSGFKTAKEKARKARSTFRGNEMIDNAGSARSAKRQIVARGFAKQLLVTGGQAAINGGFIKNPAIRGGANFASGVVSWGLLINDIHQYQDVRRANGDKK